MKIVFKAFIMFIATIGLTGCGKPPKDVTRKLVLSYFPGAELTLDDIKYLSAFSKDGGYVVNIQAGDALCEMLMIKGDKEWIAKGISCNGDFLSPEKEASRKKERIVESLKKEIADLNTTGPKTLDNGVRIEKYSFDGSYLSVNMTSPLTSSAFTQEVKNELASKLTENICLKPEYKDILSVGLSYAAFVDSADGSPLFTLIVNDFRCRGNGATGGNGIESVTAANWENEVSQFKGLVVVNFYAVWSEPSQQLDTTISELAKEYMGKVKVKKLNIDEEPKIGAMYKLEGIPLLSKII